MRKQVQPFAPDTILWIDDRGSGRRAILKVRVLALLGRDGLTMKDEPMYYVEEIEPRPGEKYPAMHTSLLKKSPE